jgi:hypothetical protein
MLLLSVMMGKRGERNTSQRWAAAAADLGNILPREID